MTNQTGRRRTPLIWMLTLIAVIGGVGMWSVTRAVDDRADEITRVGDLNGALSSLAPPEDIANYGAVNYLLVGSDSRAGVDASDPDYGALGSEATFGGQRSDTIIIMRQEANGGVAMVSLPRDLYVEIAGTGRSSRINAAYEKGPERLAATITQEFGIPIHHFVGVDFSGFKAIVNTIGGVEVCTDGPARDAKSKLDLPGGCVTLDGVQALAYARSRYYQEWDGNRWVSDARSDLGRIERQQTLIRSAAKSTMSTLKANPFVAGDLIAAVAASLSADSGLDPFSAAETLRAAMGNGMRTFSIPVYPDMVGSADVLRLGDGADSVFAYFRGEGPAPTEFETTGSTRPTGN